MVLTNLRSNGTANLNLLRAKKFVFEIRHALLFAGRDIRATLVFPVFTQFGFSLFIDIASIYHPNRGVKISQVRDEQPKLLSSLFSREQTS